MQNGAENGKIGSLISKYIWRQQKIWLPLQLFQGDLHLFSIYSDGVIAFIYLHFSKHIIVLWFEEKITSYWASLYQNNSKDLLIYLGTLLLFQWYKPEIYVGRYGMVWSFIHYWV